MAHDDEGHTCEYHCRHRRQMAVASDHQGRHFVSGARATGRHDCSMQAPRSAIDQEPRVISAEC